jgi:hypothetical protein
MLSLEEIKVKIVEGYTKGKHFWTSEIVLGGGRFGHHSVLIIGLAQK